LRVLGRMCGHDRMGGRCRTNGAPSRLGLMAAFDFRRQLVFNVTHAEYDRIDALKL
jgi:mRNA-degrading endonuclease HigB of HigAB toxin-antitoxin module